MRLGVIFLCIALGGCSLSSNAPKPKALPIAASYSETTGSISQPIDSEWWSAFGDPILDQAIREGLSGNLDIKMVLWRIQEAESNVAVAGSAGLPSINFDASFNRSKQTGKMKEVSGWVNKSLYGVSANWLIDIFGEVRAQVQSANAGREATVQGLAIARLALLSDIAASYIDARYYQELGAISGRSAKSLARTLELTRALKNQGVASLLDESKAQEALLEAQADVPGHEANFLRSAHRMSTLMGKPANSSDELLAARQLQPLPKFNPDAGIPADLVRNRPDIRKAELEFIAAVADIGYARAQFFPSITLSGSITPSYISTNAKSGSLTTWSFGPALRLPIFEGGRLKANLEIAKSRAKQKELAWRGAVLKAIEEVENALVSYNRERTALKILEDRVAANRRASDLSAMAYKEGVKSLLETLDAERELYDAQARLAASRRNLALNFVAVNIAVGRGLANTSPAEVAVSSK